MDLRGAGWSRAMVLLVLSGFAAVPLRAQDDGPRMYWMAPEGTNILQAYTWFMHGNQTSPSGSLPDPDAVTAATMVVFGYNRSFSLFGRSTVATALLSAGNATSEIGEVFRQSARGPSDPYLQVTTNLFGGPAIPLASFPDYDQRTLLWLLVGGTVPVGDYDESRFVNMGENRWAIRVGTPFVQRLGRTASGGVTTLEVIPSVWFYGKNGDSLGSELEQDPIFLLEAHVTHDVTEGLFASLDYLFQGGGETTVDGIGEDNAQAGGQLGITAGMQVTDALRVDVRYAASLTPGPNDLDSDLIQLNLLMGWF